MNIFVTDTNPTTAAQNLCDKHVVKMILESAQLLSTAKHMTNSWSPEMYKPAYLHHPCTLWAAASYENSCWLYEHYVAMLCEYTDRYGKVHASERLVDCLTPALQNFDTVSLTPFVQAMPDQYKNPDPVMAYRAYYVGEKARFAVWKNSAVPDWFVLR